MGLLYDSSCTLPLELVQGLFTVVAYELVLYHLGELPPFANKSDLQFTFTPGNRELMVIPLVVHTSFDLSRRSREHKEKPDLQCASSEEVACSMAITSLPHLLLDGSFEA